jgi:hypothetical protein
MRILLVGTVPPPGGLAARSFAREAARRTALGDSVEVLSPDPLSSAHQIANLRGRRLARELRARADLFEGVELRVDATLGQDGRPAAGLAAALARYGNVTLFVDSPIPFRAGTSAAGVRALWASATSIIVANEADGVAVVAAGADSRVIEVAPRHVGMSGSSEEWPDASDPTLQASVLAVARRRARADAGGPGGTGASSMLVSSIKRVRPSLTGSTVWLIRRVIGKTRGAVTKVLRPTPKAAR